MPEFNDLHFHSHPVDEIDVETVKCTRCKVLLIESKSVMGSMAVSTLVPTTGSTRQAVLCGACSISFMEFILPALNTDPTFQAYKSALMAAWG